jgi:SAM-dependent methyltransferase
MSTSRAPSAALQPDEASPYWRFYEEVAAVQVATWAPATPSRVLDLSGGRLRFAAQLVRAGHEVVQVRRDAADLPAADGDAAASPLTVLADSRSLAFLADACVDAVLAEGRALSMCLATEETAHELLRVLRPGGRLLLVVDSLTTGLARLADQGRWAELADVPRADVVLVPAGPDDPDGTITRCFWPEEVAALLATAGFTVDWVRPRTVLSPAAVERAVEQGGDAALRALVATEVQLAVDRTGEAGGLHLAASARRPG